MDLCWLNQEPQYLDMPKGPKGVCSRRDMSLREWPLHVIVTTWWHSNDVINLFKLQKLITNLFLHNTTDAPFFPFFCLFFIWFFILYLFPSYYFYCLFAMLRYFHLFVRNAKLFFFIFIYLIIPWCYSFVCDIYCVLFTLCI